MKKLSIIVPMYNVGPYVERCLRSLEEQNIFKKDYEIICINDGSPDNCREIVINLQGEFGNIVLIDQENQGVSRARNNGINSATGKYLLFIDPDDYVEKNSFERILSTAEKYEAQVSFLGFTFLKVDGQIHKVITNEDHKDKVFSGIEAYFKARGDGNTDPDRMVAVLFRTDFFRNYNLSYLPEVPYLEDGEFLARILCLAENCIFDGYTFYQRTTRPGSATNSRLFNSERATKGFLIATENLKKFQQNQNLNEKQREFLNQPILKFLLLALNSSIGWKLNNRLPKTIKAIKQLKLKKINLKGCYKNYRFYGNVYNVSPYLASLALILYPRIDRIYRQLSRQN